MQKMMRLCLCAAVLLGVTRCSGSTEATEAVLTGVVRTEGLDSKIIAGASITASNLSQPIITGLDGRFSLPKSKIGEAITVQVAANGYAPQTRYVNSTGTARDLLNVNLRARQDSKVTLPAAGEAPVSFSVGLNGGSATVSIPPLSLVDANGLMAQGNVTINMAYWSYFDYQNSAPLPLLAQADNPNDAPTSLTTYGMADITVVQNGQALQVAPNKTLGLTFAIPAQQQNLVAGLVANQTLAPRFYSGDQNIGLWIQEGTLADGTLSFDSNAMTMTGQMAHLSTWNLDNSFTNHGGCVSGTIVGADGVTPTANQQVRIYFLSRDEVSSFTTVTDANGAYCQNIGTNVADTTVSYYVAQASDVTQSNMCNPMPSYCSDCSGAGSWQDPNNGAEFCSFCVLRNTAICSDPENGDINGSGVSNQGCSPLPICDYRSSEQDLVNNCAVGTTAAGAYPLLGYVDACSPQTPVAEIDMCHFCPGTTLPATCAFNDLRSTGSFSGTPTVGGCGNLGTTSFVPGTMVLSATKAICDPTATTTKYVGQACAAGVDTCCPTSTLACEDLLCVPKSDG